MLINHINDRDLLLMTSGAMYSTVPTALVSVVSSLRAVPKSHNLSTRPFSNSRILYNTRQNFMHTHTHTHSLGGFDVPVKDLFAVHELQSFHHLKGPVHHVVHCVRQLPLLMEN